MKAFIILLLTLSFASCEDYVKVDFTGKDSKNSCLIDALVYKSAYDAQTQLSKFTWSKILVIEFTKTNGVVNGHVVVIFMVNTKDSKNSAFNTLWAFDRMSGSRQIPMCLKDKPYSTAVYLYGKEDVLQAFYLE